MDVILQTTSLFPFIEWKIMYFVSDIIQVCFWGSNWQYIWIVSGNGLVSHNFVCMEVKYVTGWNEMIYFIPLNEASISAHYTGPDTDASDRTMDQSKCLVTPTKSRGLALTHCTGTASALWNNHTAEFNSITMASWSLKFPASRLFVQ